MQQEQHLFDASDAREPAEGTVRWPAAVQGAANPDLVQMVLLPLVKAGCTARHVRYYVLPIACKHTS